MRAWAVPLQGVMASYSDPVMGKTVRTVKVPLPTAAAAGLILLAHLETVIGDCLQNGSLEDALRWPKNDSDRQMRGER